MAGALQNAPYTPEYRDNADANTNTGYGITPGYGIMAEWVSSQPEAATRLIDMLARQLSEEHENRRRVERTLEAILETPVETMRSTAAEENRQVDISEIEKLYSLSDRESVSDFLAQNPDVLALLPQLSPFICRYFPDSVLTLRVFNDPEEPETPVLTIWIGMNGDPSADVDAFMEMNSDQELRRLRRSVDNLSVAFGSIR